MDRLRKFIGNPIQKATMGFAFLVFFIAKSHAQLGTPPIIAVQPLGVAVQNGGTAVITTTAVSLTSMRFYWLINNQPVPATNTTVVNVNIPLVGTVSALTINKVSSANAGDYSVHIVNGVGSVNSSNATLVVLGSTVSNVLNIVSAGTGMTVNGFKIQLSGPAGSNYVIQASTNLKNWVAISTNAAPSGSVSFTDTAVTNFAFRYYRAMIQ